jgi:tetratricopeptide (TPR) repeat protein
MPGYDAFISYSHAADARLAPALQRALQRFAKPWWKLRALNLFRDETSLAAAANLTGALVKALDTSRFFILLASPRAAASRWCNEEVAHWLRRRSADTLLIVLTEGTVAWDEAGRDFDWRQTDALPPALKGAISTEPFWLDLSWARQSEQLSERDPRFQQVVAKLAATLHGRSLEDISGEDVRVYRSNRRLATGAVAAIAALAIGAGIAAWQATRAREEADLQRIFAEGNADEARRQREAALKSEQEAKAQRDAAERALAQTLAATDTLVVEIVYGMKDFTGVPRARLRRVLERAEKILDATPADSDSQAFQRRRINLYWQFADVMLALGDKEQAQRRARSALDIALQESGRAPLSGDWQRALAVSFYVMGDVQRAQGDLAEALRNYHASRVVAEALVEGYEYNADWQRDLAAVLGRIGDVQMQQEELADALRWYEAQLKIAERLARSDPGNAIWQHDLAGALGNVGGVQMAQGELAAALRSYRASLDIVERLVERDKANAFWQRSLSSGLRMIGEVQMRQGAPADALRAFERGRVIAERLARSDDDNTDWQRDLALAWAWEGDARLAQRDSAGALRSYEASLAIRDRLAKGNIGNADLQSDLAMGWQRLGNAQMAQDDLSGALRSYEASRAIRERLVQISSGNTPWQLDLAGSLQRIAMVMEKMPGRLADARDAWQREIELLAALAAANRLAPDELKFIDRARTGLAAVDKRLAAGDR